jgi:hypothetical protein
MPHVRVQRTAQMGQAAVVGFFEGVAADHEGDCGRSEAARVAGRALSQRGAARRAMHNARAV